MIRVSKERFEQFKNTVKRFYSWELILHEAGITEYSDKGDQLEIKCILHEDWNPSMRLTKSTGVYHCFSCGAAGTYTKFLWELTGRSLPYMVFCDQILQSHPEIQAELGFTSLFISEKTLDPEFDKRRVFNKSTGTNTELPIVSLAREVMRRDNTWKGLVLSLSLLQQGVRSDNVLSLVKRSNIPLSKDLENKEISVMDLLGG